MIGPGKVGQALGITLLDSGRELGEWLNIYPRLENDVFIRRDKRVGIDYAKLEDRNALWRFILISDK